MQAERTLLLSKCQLASLAHQALIVTMSMEPSIPRIVLKETIVHQVQKLQRCAPMEHTQRASRPASKTSDSARLAQLASIAQEVSGIVRTSAMLATIAGLEPKHRMRMTTCAQADSSVLRAPSCQQLVKRANTPCLAPRLKMTVSTVSQDTIVFLVSLLHT